MRRSKWRTEAPGGGLVRNGSLAGADSVRWSSPEGKKKKERGEKEGSATFRFGGGLADGASHSLPPRIGG